MDKHNWEGVNYPSEKDDRKKFKKNNLALALNVFYVKKGKIYPAYAIKQLKS